VRAKRQRAVAEHRNLDALDDARGIGVAPFEDVEVGNVVGSSLDIEEADRAHRVGLKAMQVGKPILDVNSGLEIAGLVFVDRECGRGDERDRLDGAAAMVNPVFGKG